MNDVVDRRAGGLMGDYGGETSGVEVGVVEAHEEAHEVVTHGGGDVADAWEEDLQDLCVWKKVLVSKELDNILNNNNKLGKRKRRRRGKGGHTSMSNLAMTVSNKLGIRY